MMANQGTTSVWFQLYIGQDKSGSPDLVVLSESESLIVHLRKAVKEEWPELNETAAARLKVYPAGTSVPVSEGTEPIDPGDNVPRNTSSRNPLIVIAPPRELDERKPGKLISPFYAFMVALI
jgi:hypothetical protein